MKPGARGAHGANIRSRLRHKVLKQRCDDEAAWLCAKWNMERIQEEAKPWECIREANKMAANADKDLANDLAKANKDKFNEYYERWVSVRDMQCNEYAGIVFCIDDVMGAVALWIPDDTNMKAAFKIIKLAQLLEVEALSNVKALVT
jgi:hypothetical protein